jgi:hypothetical protein
MPTGAEYRAMAAELTDRADALVEMVEPLIDAWGDDVVSVSSRLGLTIARTVEATDANASSAATTMRAMAAECLARAAVCDQYAAAMARYRADVVRYQDDIRVAAGDPLVPPSSRPTRPTAPAWAEA